MFSRHVRQLLRPCSVEDLPGLSVLLDLYLVLHLLSRKVLVHETFSVHIQIQESCNTHNADALKVSAAAHVMDHRCMALLNLSACPHSKFDTVTLVGHISFYVHVGEHTGDTILNDIRAEMFYHCLVLRVITGRHDHTFFCGDLEIFSGLRITYISTCTSSVFHDQLLCETSVMSIYISGIYSSFHVLIDSHRLILLELYGSRVAREFLFGPVIVLRQRIEDRDQEVVCILVRDCRTGLICIVKIRVCLYPPVKYITDVVCPFAHDRTFYFVVGLLHMEIHHLVDLLIRPGISAPASLYLSVDNCILTTSALRTVCLLHNDNGSTFLCCGSCCCNSGNTSSDDQHICAQFFFYHIISDLRLGSQPVFIRRSTFCTLCGSSCQTACLCDTVVQTFLNCIAGQGCT